MFYRYEIKNNGSEDILYLYLTMSYEFSKDLNNSSSNKEISRRANNFIKNNNINYNGTKVYLVVNDIVVKSIDIKNNKEDIELLNDKLFYSNDEYLVTLKLIDDSFVEITLREYLLGCLACNIIPDLSNEVLKAMTLLFRTYAFREMTEKKFINLSNSMVSYKNISYYKLNWIDNYDKIISNLNKAIDETDCIFITHKGYYILPFFHTTNNGKTIDSNGYPYLKSISSLWDYASPYYIDIKDYNYYIFSKLLKCNQDDLKDIKIYNKDGKSLFSINNYVYNISTIKNILSLNSDDITIIVNKDFIRFITRGFGKFYGLSLYGANEISKSGCDYLNILKYYFNDIEFNKYIKELS